jgi:hypothetical protein
MVERYHAGTIAALCTVLGEGRCIPEESDDADAGDSGHVPVNIPKWNDRPERDGRAGASISCGDWIVARRTRSVKALVATRRLACLKSLRATMPDGTD